MDCCEIRIEPILVRIARFLPERSRLDILVRMLKNLAIAVLVLAVSLAGHADECERGLELAEEIAQMRDIDAAAGVERGVAALENLTGEQVECPLSAAMLERAIATNLHILGDLAEALDRSRSALALLEQVENVEPEQFALVHLTTGVVLWELEAQDEAIRHYRLSMDASESAGDLIGMGRAAGNIGNLYSTIGDLVRARQHHELALDAFEQAESISGMAGSLVNLAALSGRNAQLALDEGDTVQAEALHEDMLDFGRRALERFEGLENPRGIAYAAANVAAALEGLGRPVEALRYHERAMNLRREVGDTRGQTHSLFSMARTLFATQQYEQASALLDQATGMLPAENIGMAIEISRLQVKVEQAREDYRAALEHQKELTRLSQLVAESQMAARVEEVRVAMEGEQLDREVQLLRSEAEISELKLKRQQAMFIVAVLVALLLLALLALLFMRYRTRLKTSRQLDVVARTDSLTGLPNRRDMLERIGAAHAEAVSEGVDHGLILADIDDFKQINDLHGHAVGDKVLTHVARIMNNSVKGRDVVARWGGEEFLILLPRTGAEGAATVAEDLRTAVFGHPAETTSGRFELSLSLGVAILNSATMVDEAISRADRAMYQAKRAGKNRYEIDPGTGV